MDTVVGSCFLSPTETLAEPETSLLVIFSLHNLPVRQTLNFALVPLLCFLLYEAGGVLGVTQAVVLSAGFSSFHLADIDSGRNVFIVGFSIFMALLLPRWLREAPVLLNTGKWGGGEKKGGVGLRL